MLSPLFNCVLANIALSHHFVDLDLVIHVQVTRYCDNYNNNNHNNNSNNNNNNNNKNNCFKSITQKVVVQSLEPGAHDKSGRLL